MDKPFDIIRYRTYDVKELISPEHLTSDVINILKYTGTISTVCRDMVDNDVISWSLPNATHVILIENEEYSGYLHGVTTYDGHLVLIVNFNGYGLVTCSLTHNMLSKILPSDIIIDKPLIGA